MKPVSLTVIALLAALALAGCGASSSEEATDPAATPSPSSSSATPSASEEPTSGSDTQTFAPTNYSYVLRVSCFCPLTSRPVHITVTDGKVGEAVWLRNSPDTTKGEPVTEPWLNLTIQDVIDEANNPENDDVDIDWPQGQDYPNRVSVDPEKMIVDEERSFQISQVEITG